MVKRLSINFEHHDKRGIFIEITRSSQWKQVNFFTIKKGHLRGGHYHKRISELFFVIEGKCVLTTVDIRNKSKIKMILREKDIVVLSPYEVHYLRAINNTKMIALLSTAHRMHNPDTYEQ